ncbi:MAG: hypothetical protein WB755_02480 [Terriglobales bacterium]
MPNASGFFYFKRHVVKAASLKTGSISTPGFEMGHARQEKGAKWRNSGKASAIGKE